MRLLIGRSWLLTLLALLSLSCFGFYDTPKFWKCENRVGGSWRFGEAPYACDIAPLLDEVKVEQDFGPLIYRGEELTDYMESIVPLIKEAARFYILKRDPLVSEEEVVYFEKAAVAVAHQESYITHFRKGSDGRIKVMRGDYGHGHGIMQVDDRWHFIEVESGRAWNLVSNIMYSLEEYYAGWKKAPNKNCVDGAEDYKGRARAAYSAYNGGPSKICRFENSDDIWARNDRGFLDKLENMNWSRYISSTGIKSPVDIKCYMDSAKISCDDPIEEVDKHNLAFLELHSIFRVGLTIVPLKNINMRISPGGTWLGTVPKLEPLEVLDHKYFSESGKRYYMVQYDGITGYIYGGDNNSFFNWIDISEELPSSYFIANIKDHIKIENSSGINLREIISKEVISVIKKGEVVLVENVTIETKNNSIFYTVSYDDRVGRVYGGQIFPQNTTTRWATVTEYIPEIIYGRLIDGLYFRFFKKCPKRSCSYGGGYIYRGYRYSQTKQFEILESDNGMVRVKSLKSGKVGWLYERDVEEL